MEPLEHELDRGIAVTRSSTGVPGEYAAHLDGGWVVGGGVNGGYVLAVAGNAIRSELADAGHVDPISVSSCFLTPSRPGPAVVRVRKVREGGRRTTVAASLVQEEDGAEVERITVLAVYGVLDASDAEEPLRQLDPPELPPLEQCVASADAPPDVRGGAPLLERLGTRIDPACVGWAVGQPSGNGLIQGWFRFADDRPLDSLALLVVVDALPPATFDLGRPGWAPTLELTAHVRARPAPGWAIVRHATRNVSGGMFEEDCEVWDSTGRLVAQSRQLALLPR
jgi:hypothetical protein